jgi:hypothetical protein
MARTRWWIVKLATLAIATSASGVTRADCDSAFEAAQRLRRVSRLQAAEREAVTCAGLSCPTWMQKECAGWVEEIRRALPSIIVRVLGPDGCDVDAARYSLDGEVPATVDGKPLALDPGQHTIRVTASGLPQNEQRVVVVEGETSRLVLFSYAPGRVCGPTPSVTTSPTTGSRAPPPPDRPVPSAALIVGGAGVIALGVGGALEIVSLGRKSAFERCSPDCDSGDVSSWRTTWRTADVLVGVGIVSIAVAAYLYLTRPSSPAAPTVSGSFL